MLRFGVLGIATGCALLWASGASFAQPAAPLPLELAWSAPDECASAEEVRAELERIAPAPSGEALKPLAANVVITQESGRYHAQLHTEQEGRTGERALQAEDCKTLVRSITLVLALAFGRGTQVEDASDGTTESGTGGATQGSTNVPQPPAATESPAEPVVETRDEVDEPLVMRFGLLFGGGAQLALFPVASPQIQAGAALDFDALAIELRVAALPAVSKTLTSTAGDAPSARFDGLATTALGCARMSLLSLCAGARAAALRAQSRGVSQTGSATAPWYALIAAVSLAWPKHSAVQVGVEGLLGLSLNRPRFVVLGLGEAQHVPVLAPELSLLLRFWP